MAGAGQQQNDTVIEISDDDADVGNDGCMVPAGAGGKQQRDSAGEDGAEGMLVDMADDRLVKADPGQVGCAAG